MPVTTSYPGIYIEEIPSTNRTISPAPTSIAAFVGYSHPFQTKTDNFGKAVLVFSFSEYERELGGFFASGTLSGNLPLAVHQFFLNGGAQAYVVPLKVALDPPTAALETASGTIALTAKELVDTIPMTITATSADGTEAEITITYGTRVETMRKVKFADVRDAIATSALVSVADPATAPAGTLFKTGTTTATFAVAAGGTPFNATQFNDVFDEEAPLDKVEIFNILVLPGIEDAGVLSNALAFAVRKRAFMILDPEQSLAADNSEGLADIATDFSTSPLRSPNGAIYFPYLKSQHPITNEVIEVPPSGFVAGLFARTDTNRGVWKAPAGLETTILNTTGVVDRGRMTDMRAGVLNQRGVNAIRSFAGVGTVIFGARTLVSENPAFQPWKYVPVRRTALFIEQTLFRELKWTIFEPNDTPLWTAITLSVDNFMRSLFNQGAFQGSKPSQAYLVKCDATTTTQSDIDNGIVNIIVGFCPLKPAEFVIVKITQLAGQVQS